MNTLESKLDAAAMLHAIVNRKVDWEKVNIKGLEETADEFEFEILETYFKDQLEKVEDCVDFVFHHLSEDEAELLKNMHSKTFFAWSNEGEHINQLKIEIDGPSSK